MNTHRDLAHVHPRRKRAAMIAERERVDANAALAVKRSAAAQKAAATRKANKAKP